MANKNKFYAVRVGRKPGIYRTWDECREQVDEYSNAVYRSFLRLEEAEDYLNGPGSPESHLAAAAETETLITVPQPVSRVSWDKALLKQVLIYGDGACTGNPGRGGYGAVLLHGERRKEFSAGFRLTTNNRMEILACIVGLQALKEPCDVTIYSDSKYVVNAMTKSWAMKWRQLGWKRKLENGQLADALNADLWTDMLDLCDIHRVQFNWVRGHSGHKENERCDQLARGAAASNNLGIDTMYENGPGKTRVLWRSELNHIKL